MKCVFCEKDASEQLRIHGKTHHVCWLCYKQLYYHFRDRMYEVIKHPIK